MNNSHIQTLQVSFSNIINWDVLQIIEKKTAQDKVNSDFDFTRIRDFVIVKRRKIKLEDAKVYKRITTQLYQKGIILRDEIDGKSIKTKTQFIVKTGDIVISKINARKAGFGIVPKELNDAIVSSEYLVLNIDKQQVLKQFFILIINSDWFIERLENLSLGTTFKRITINDFLNLEIPLPLIEEQEKIVTTYQKIIKTAEKEERIYKAIKPNLVNYLHTILGISVRKLDFLKGEIIDYSSINNWDIWNSINDYHSEIYESVSLGALVIEKPKYGSNQAVSNSLAEIRYLRITDIDDWNTLKETGFSPQKVEKRFLLEHNDFLLARSGSVGKALLYKRGMGKVIFAGYLICFRLNEKLINPDYLMFYTQSKIFQEWIDKNQNGIAQPNINAHTFLKLPIVLPPLTIQNEIANYWIDKRKEAIKLKQVIKAQKAAATDYFNQTIFKQN